VDAILEADRRAPRKQRHTAHRIWTRMKSELSECKIAERTVREYVHDRKIALGLNVRETCVPQSYAWGVEAQIDWYEAYADMGGERIKLQVFGMRSMASGASFHCAYLHATQQAFLEAHELAFAYFGGVFRKLRYDNLTSAAKKILRGHRRKRRRDSWRSVRTGDSRRSFAHRRSLMKKAASFSTQPLGAGAGSGGACRPERAAPECLSAGRTSRHRRTRAGGGSRQPRPLHPILRDEVYRIGREAVVNAFRHSRAARIEVELQYSAKQLRVLVRDNGCGIDPLVLQSGREGHWGLSGMRERAEKMGAHFHVCSRAASGTEVELSVPGHVAFKPLCGADRGVGYPDSCPERGVKRYLDERPIHHSNSERRSSASARGDCHHYSKPTRHDAGGRGRLWQRGSPKISRNAGSGRIYSTGSMYSR
jgi:hypothetical protein